VVAALALARHGRRLQLAQSREARVEEVRAGGVRRRVSGGLAWAFVGGR